MWVWYWVGKRLCSRWVAFVFFSQESLQASTWCLSDFVEFVSFIQCDSSSRVRFHITLASHWEQFTENWSQWEAKNQPRFKLDRLTGAPRIKNKAQFQIIWQQDMFVIQWHEMNELTTCRYYVKSFHLKPWNDTRSLLFHLGRKSLWYERFLWRCA